MTSKGQLFTNFCLYNQDSIEIWVNFHLNLWFSLQNFPLKQKFAILSRKLIFKSNFIVNFLSNLNLKQTIEGRHLTDFSPMANLSFLIVFGNFFNETFDFLHLNRIIKKIESLLNFMEIFYDYENFWGAIWNWELNRSDRKMFCLRIDFVPFATLYRFIKIYVIVLNLKTALSNKLGYQSSQWPRIYLQSTLLALLKTIYYW